MNAEKAPLFERLGTKYLQALGGGAFVRPAQGDAREAHAHVLAPHERDTLRAIVRGAVTRACVAGALSALVSAAADVVASRDLPDAGATTEQTIHYWVVVGGATAIASVFELLVL